MRTLSAAVALLLGVVHCSDHEDRLLLDLFGRYNSLIQPVYNLSELPIIVQIALQLVLLINVEEKDQVMHTNVWLTLRWYDYQMRWNPVNYGDIQSIRVSPDKVWLPDIVLFNNADGTYEVSFMCNVVIEHTGQMLWVPPAIYKSSCLIDVEYFPFDEQMCHLTFGSWTYNEQEIELRFGNAQYVDLSEYSDSSIWDLIDAPAKLLHGKSRVQFQVKIRRKTLFYTVVLIIPTVLMAFLSMAVFFLPTDSGEKITLAISVLLSIVVFLLLVSKILPPTSLTIPLMAKYGTTYSILGRYLLLTFVLNVITILVTVIIINVYFRGPSTHRMPQWVRSLFLEVMPQFLCVSKPKSIQKRPKKKQVIDLTELGIGQFTLKTQAHHPFCPSADVKTRLIAPNLKTIDPSTKHLYPLSPDAIKAIEAIEYISNHLRLKEEQKTYRDDWKFVAMIIDRLLLYVFFGITVGGTYGILLSAPHVWDVVDQKEVIRRLVQKYKAT